MYLNNDLNDFIKSTHFEIQQEYERIMKRVLEDPGTAGDQGEENWATIFKEWLPPTFHVVTKGRIIGVTGNASRQVDVLILRPEYPKKLRDKKLYLAEGVLAAFECKLTLRSEHIESAFKTSKEIKSLTLPRKGSPYAELHSPIIFGLLSHSEEFWKNMPYQRPDNTMWDKWGHAF